MRNIIIAECISTVDDVDSIRGNFELIIINLNRSLVKRSETDKVDIILKIFSKIKTGGIILIPENTYQMLSNGRRSVEALIKVLDYKIELPPYDIKDVIIASKRL